MCRRKRECSEVGGLGVLGVIFSKQATEFVTVLWFQLSHRNQQYLLSGRCDRVSTGQGEKRKEPSTWGD